MAVNLLSHDVSELCLGKPALRSLSLAATVAEALSALKRLGEISLSVWDCHCSAAGHCRCVGKVSVSDVICFLAREENLKSPTTALQAPIADLIPKPYGLVSHLEPNASLLEAIDLILQEGAQNLVIPIRTQNNNNNNSTKISSRKLENILQKPSFSSTRHNNRDHCWITEEDIIRYLLNCIGLFSPIPSATIASLGLVRPRPAVRHDSPAAAAAPLLARGAAVAVADHSGRLVGEISPAALDSCDEAAAAALATLSAGELAAYADYMGPPEEMVRAVRARLEERGLGPAVDVLMEEDYCTPWLSSSSSSSSDEEFGRSSGRVAAVRPCEAIVCRPWSSLVAVMIQALAHRSGYVWVVEEDGTLAGIVTFAGILSVLRHHKM